MELRSGDNVVLRYNKPNEDLGLHPGMIGTSTGESLTDFLSNGDKVVWKNIQWPHHKWWVPEDQIKRIKS
jgi:hypothetical protein